MKKNHCDDVKNNSKNFSKYVNNKRKNQVNVRIPQLCKPSTNKKVYWEADYDKAEALALQFNKVLKKKTLPDSKLVFSFDAATIPKNSMA